DILRAYPSVDPATVHVVHNGIDIDQWAPNPETSALTSRGIDPEAPTVVFVGRITRQKGLPYFLRAVRELPAEYQVVLCAGAPDTPESAEDVDRLAHALSTTRGSVHLSTAMRPPHARTHSLTPATTRACPNIYGPRGTVNLEAMACGTRVVAS